MPEAIANRTLAVLRQVGEDVLQWIPLLIVGLLVAVLALLAAKLGELVLRLLLRRLRIGELLSRAGLDRMIEQAGIRQPADVLIPRIAYYLLLFLFARAGADALGLAAVSETLGTLLGYVPNVAGAALVLLAGGRLATVAGCAAARAAERTGIDHARGLGVFATWTLFFVVAVTAVGQLRIETEMIRLVTAGALAGLALGFGLAFGLGAREILRNILAGFYARQIFESGKIVEFRGERGTLMSVTATQTLLEQADRMVSISNRSMLEEVVKQDM